ncbi:hypothetical protein OG427_05605 [Streptomyces sp. NBC_00133]|uniref:hypothetical protein n=1 Tax=Streptomyces sp. NBC_00133 TaxID=2903624 RepID=UPI003250FCB1
MAEETTQQVGPWLVRAVWGAGPFPMELHITTDDAEAAAHGITQTVLREVQLNRLVAFAGHRLKAVEAADAVADAVMALNTHSTGAKGSLSEDYYRALAEAYSACRAVFMRHPVKYLAEETGRNAGTIRNHLTKARKLGYLEGD